MSLFKIISCSTFWAAPFKFERDAKVTLFKRAPCPKVTFLHPSPMQKYRIGEGCKNVAFQNSIMFKMDIFTSLPDLERGS